MVHVHIPQISLPKTVYIQFPLLLNSHLDTVNQYSETAAIIINNVLRSSQDSSHYPTIPLEDDRFPSEQVFLTTIISCVFIRELHKSPSGFL